MVAQSSHEVDTLEGTMGLKVPSAHAWHTLIEVRLHSDIMNWPAVHDMHGAKGQPSKIVSMGMERDAEENEELVRAVVGHAFDSTRAGGESSTLAK